MLEPVLLKLGKARGLQSYIYANEPFTTAHQAALAVAEAVARDHGRRTFEGEMDEPLLPVRELVKEQQ